MALSTIIWIVLIVVIIAIAAYVYYHYANQTEFFRTATRTVSKKRGHRKTPNQKQKKLKAGDKQVRFDSNVACKTFQKHRTDTPIDPIHTPSYRPRKPKTDSQPIIVDTIRQKQGQNLSEEPSEQTPGQKVRPSNLEYSDKEWDAGFGLPLMNPKDKAKFIKQMQQNHDKYQQSMGQFTDYQMDRSTVIETDTTINPFQNAANASYDGMTVADIYDRQTAGIKAKPKRVTRRTADQTIYSDETELNGGKLQGTHLQAFDTGLDTLQSAAFGNGFDLS